jgi:hypothetical protein
MPTEPENGLTAGPEERFVADRLREERPVPRPTFRGALGRHLASRDPGYGPRPERLRLIVGAYLATGAVLLALGALLGVGAI